MKIFLKLLSGTDIPKDDDQLLQTSAGRSVDRNTQKGTLQEGAVPFLQKTGFRIVWVGGDKSAPDPGTEKVAFLSGLPGNRQFFDKQWMGRRSGQVFREKTRKTFSRLMKRKNVSPGINLHHAFSKMTDQRVQMISGGLENLPETTLFPLVIQGDDDLLLAFEIGQDQTNINGNFLALPVRQDSRES